MRGSVGAGGGGSRRLPGVIRRDLGGVWRVPIYWPGGVRHRGGVTLACGFRRERGKASADMVPRAGFDGTIGSAPGGRNREKLSTVAVFAGGPSRSSDEAPVMGVEPRGRLIRDGSLGQLGEKPGGAR